MLRAASVGGGVQFRCAIVGYQFPESQADDWCLVEVALEQGPDTFQTVDPALEAADLLRVRDWFHCLATERLPRRAHLSFIEPCLGFEYISRSDAGIRLGVHLAAELAPPFPLTQFSATSRQWQIVFELDSSSLLGVVAELDDTIRRFPIRSRSFRGWRCWMA